MDKSKAFKRILRKLVLLIFIVFLLILVVFAFESIKERKTVRRVSQERRNGLRQ